MALPSVTILVNQSTNDTVCTNPAGDSNWKTLDSGDAIAWRDTTQADGDASTGVSYPVIVPGAGSLEAPKTFHIDDSAELYQQVPLAGTVSGEQSGGATRYVFAAYINGATAGVPYLEAWNTSAHAASNGSLLGSGVAANSLIRAISTTEAAPGSNAWAGTPLAGESDRIALSGEALTVAAYMYWNMKMLVPSTFGALQSTDYVLAVRILYS